MKFIIAIVFIALVNIALSKPNGFQLSNYAGSRIVGGVNAKPNEFPYQVSLQKWEQHFCGGSILTETYVLSAAHCEQDDLDDVEAVAGEHDLSKESGREQRRKVVEFIVHEGFKGGVSPNDISLVVLESPFKLNKYVQKVHLPPANEYPKGDAMGTGWGSVNKDPNSEGAYPDILQKANLPVQSQEKCMELWAGGNSKYAKESNLCAGPLSGKSSTCPGDSGGPLAQKSGGKTILIGIVSWGQVPCGSPNAPGVFVWVAKYNDWIEKNMD